MATTYHLATADRQPDEPDGSISFPVCPGVTSVAERFTDVMRQAKHALGTVRVNPAAADAGRSIFDSRHNDPPSVQRQQYRQRHRYERINADRRPPLRRHEISFSQGAAWKALINAYISAIPFNGEAFCMPMQSMSGWPLNKPVHSAMMANVGAAARPGQPAAPEAVWPPPARVSTP